MIRPEQQDVPRPWLAPHVRAIFHRCKAPHGQKSFPPIVRPFLISAVCSRYQMYVATLFHCFFVPVKIVMAADISLKCCVLSDMPHAGHAVDWE